MQDGDEGGSSLPTYEIAANPEGFAGDWEKAYIFKAKPDSEVDLNDSGRVENWSIGYVEDANGETLQELLSMAKGNCISERTLDIARVIAAMPSERLQALGIVLGLSIN